MLVWHICVWKNNLLVAWERCGYTGMDGQRQNCVTNTVEFDILKWQLFVFWQICVIVVCCIMVFQKTKKRNPILIPVLYKMFNEQGKFKKLPDRRLY